MKVSIVDAQVDHIEPISRNVRPADREELYALGCITPSQCMLYGLSRSGFSRTGMIDDIPVCMYGVAGDPVKVRTGRPWMVGTSELDKHAGVFLRRCKNEVKEMAKAFDLLENIVDARNEKAIAWLKWLGFDFNGVPVLVGIHKTPFLTFRNQEDKICALP